MRRRCTQSSKTQSQRPSGPQIAYAATLCAYVRALGNLFSPNKLLSIPLRALYAIESLDDTYSLDTYLYVSYPPSRLDNTWAEVAADYHDQVLGPFHPLNAEHELHDLLRLHLPSKLVLDAGCGVGNLAIWCDSVGVRPSRLVGLDSSPEMVRQSLKTGYESVELGAIEKMAFQDGQFDTALAINSVMPAAASNDARRTVRECFLELRRVTKQNGTLIAVLPSFESLYETNSKDAFWHSQTDESAVAGDVGFGEKRCLHTLETINAELGAAGFSNLEVSKLSYSNEATRALGLTPGAWDWLVTARA